MAISSTLAFLLREIKFQLPQGGSLLEIGEANWYDAANAGLVPGYRDGDDMFAVAKAFYKDLFDPGTVQAIDLHGTDAAWKFDLNFPIPDIGTFDVIMNHGTAEHIFNVAQVFRTIHDHCKLDGIMIHEVPFTGWRDHGFYCLQPTLFYDLAAANGYEIGLAAIEELRSETILPIYSREFMTRMLTAAPDNSMLFFAMRKKTRHPFCFPQQGLYSMSVSAEAVKAWHELR